MRFLIFVTLPLVLTGCAGFQAFGTGLQAGLGGEGPSALPEAFSTNDVATAAGVALGGLVLVLVAGLRKKIKRKIGALWASKQDKPDVAPVTVMQPRAAPPPAQPEA